METTTLIEAWADYETAGIFARLADGYTLPWESDADAPPASYLDLIYYFNHSGEKITAPVIDKMLSADDAETLSNAREAQLTGMIYYKYIKQWTRLWNLNVSEYNPIHNYDMTEEEEYENSGENSNTRTDNLTETRNLANSNSSTETRNLTDGKTETETQNLSETNERISDSNDTDESVYGYNTSTASPERKTENEHLFEDEKLNTGTISKTGSETHTGTESVSESGTNTGTVAHTGTQADVGEKSENGTRSLTRSGNIGVTTTQRMAEEEIELWKWNFFESVFKDIDKVLTINMWNLDAI